jgi:hypothetical protein
MEEVGNTKVEKQEEGGASPLVSRQKTSQDQLC